MATLQATLTNDITPFVIKGGELFIQDNETIVQDAGAVDIVDKTVMAYNPTTLKWTPFVSLAGTDGTGAPAGIYRGDTIAAATIVAGDVVGLNIAIGAAEGTWLDEAKLVFESGTLDLDSVVGPNAPAAGDVLRTCRQALHLLNVYPVPTQNDFLIAPVVP